MVGGEGVGGGFRRRVYFCCWTRWCRRWWGPRYDTASWCTAAGTIGFSLSKFTRAFIIYYTPRRNDIVRSGPYMYMYYMIYYVYNIRIRIREYGISFYVLAFYLYIIYLYQYISFYFQCDDFSDDEDDARAYPERPNYNTSASRIIKV